MMQHKMPSITSGNSSNDGAKNNVLSIYQGHCLKAVPVGYETHVHSFVTNGPYAGQSRETLLEISPKHFLVTCIWGSFVAIVEVMSPNRTASGNHKAPKMTHDDPYLQFFCGTFLKGY